MFAVEEEVVLTGIAIMHAEELFLPELAVLHYIVQRLIRAVLMDRISLIIVRIIILVLVIIVHGMGTQALTHNFLSDVTVLRIVTAQIRVQAVLLVIPMHYPAVQELM